MRVGLTGGLGSGKTTVAEMLKDKGAFVLSADEIARKLMEPGQKVFAQIVERFGPGVVRADGTLDRAALARMAFEGGRIDELNAIVHPATIQLQGEIADEICRQHPGADIVVESALIFETPYGGNWRRRFHRMILVTAPDSVKIARFIARAGSGDGGALEADARRRLAQMIPDGDKVALVDCVIRNDGTLDELRERVDRVWDGLKRGHPCPDV